MVESKIRLANRLISITDSFLFAGYLVPEYGKTYCPWGEITHSDGGLAKALRVYPESNSAWCFAESERFDPVRVFVREYDVTPSEAAEMLLEKIGYKEPSLEARWTKAIETGREVDTNSLQDALRIACRTVIPNWDERQFEPEASYWLQRCFSLLFKVKSEEDAERWLSVSKQKIRQEMEK